MKKFCISSILIGLSVLVTHVSFAQLKDSIPLSSSIPVRFGFIRNNNPIATTLINKIDGVYIFNHLESDSVFSITNGFVQKVSKFDEDFFCLIRSGSKIIVYGPFKSFPLSVGDLVKRGDYLGAMTDNDIEDGNYNLLLTVLKRKKYLSFKQHVSLVNSLH